MHQLEPDRFAYCAIIAAHCRQCDLPSAEFFLQEMTELGVTADTAVYNTILALRVKLDVEVESMLCQMEDRGVRQNHVTRAILSRSTRRLQVPSSVLMEAANEAPDSVVAITNAMRAFAAEGNVDEVRNQQVATLGSLSLMIAMWRWGKRRTKEGIHVEKESSGLFSGVEMFTQGKNSQQRQRQRVQHSHPNAHPKQTDHNSRDDSC